VISKRTVPTLLALGCWFFFTPAVSQAILLSDLVQGQTITADDKIFKDWAVLEQVTNLGVIDLTQIDVTPLVDDPLNPGVKFTATPDALGTLFGHNGGAFVLFRFGFTVQTTTGLALIKDNSLVINDWIFDSHPNASIRISEIVRAADGDPLGTKSVIAVPGDEPNSGNPNHFDSAEFKPQSLVRVEKLIDIRGPEFNDGARLTMFEQRFSQVPEPSALAIACVGWLCLAAARAWRGR